MTNEPQPLVSEVLAAGAAGQPTRAPEPSEHELKRWEEFHNYAQDSYQCAHDRWTAADEKASKCLSILGIVIGTGAITSGRNQGSVRRPIPSRLRHSVVKRTKRTVVIAGARPGCATGSLL